MAPESEVTEDRSSGCSELVLDSRTLNASARAPMISNLHVERSTDVHIGTKVVNVIQNVHNTEIVKGQLLGLELVAPAQAQARSRRLRCSIAVFVCWALVVALGLAVYLFHLALLTNTRLDIDLQESWYLRRAQWQALPPYTVEFHRSLPLKYVLIGHSATPYCSDKTSCIKEVRSIQQDHIDRQFGDIGPNYLVSGNGLVFEGRGANVVAAMVMAWNRRSVTISYLGDYTRSPVSEVQTEHVATLLKVLQTAGVLSQDYRLRGCCQVFTGTISPGFYVMQSLRNFTNYDPTNENACLDLINIRR